MSCVKQLDEIADDRNVSTAFLMHGEAKMTLEDLSPREVTSVSKFQNVLSQRRENEEKYRDHH